MVTSSNVTRSFHNLALSMVARAPDKMRIYTSIMPISSPNSMFGHLLELSHQDYSNKCSNMWFGEEIMQLVSIEVNFCILSGVHSVFLVNLTSMNSCSSLFSIHISFSWDTWDIYLQNHNYRTKFNVIPFTLLPILIPMHGEPLLYGHKFCSNSWVKNTT